MKKLFFFILLVLLYTEFASAQNKSFSWGASSVDQEKKHIYYPEAKAVFTNVATNHPTLLASGTMNLEAIIRKDYDVVSLYVLYKKPIEFSAFTLKDKSFEAKTLSNRLNPAMIAPKSYSIEISIEHKGNKYTQLVNLCKDLQEEGNNIFTATCFVNLTDALPDLKKDQNWLKNIKLSSGKITRFDGDGMVLIASELDQSLAKTTNPASSKGEDKKLTASESSSTSNKKNQAKKLTLGIVDVYDEKSHLNYSQLFKRALQEYPIMAGKNEVFPELVEHPSQANFAFRVKIQNATMIVSYFKDGQVKSKDTVSIEKLVNKNPVFGVGIVLNPTKSGLQLKEIFPNSNLLSTSVSIGDILTKVNGTTVAAIAPGSVIYSSIGDILIKNHGNTAGSTGMDNLYDRLEGEEGSSVKLTFERQTNREAYEVEVEREGITRPSWTRPLTQESLILIFSSCIHSLKTASTDLKFYPFHLNASQNKAFKNIKLDLPDVKKSSHLFSTNASNKVHKAPMFPERDSIFNQERFIPIHISKKSAAGDAALNVLKFYNTKQVPTNFSQNRNIAWDTKKVVARITEPLYHSPGVFSNYFYAALQYEKTQKYAEALNQLYACYMLADDMTASEHVKVQSKVFLLNHIAKCTKALNQPAYSELVKLSADCLELVARYSELEGQAKDYYSFINEVHRFCETLDAQLAQQRSNNFWSTVTALASTAAGVATLSVDPLTSMTFFSTAVDIVDDNIAFNDQFNSELRSVTRSAEFNLPAELLDDEANPAETIATQTIFYALTKANNPSRILDRIQSYARNKPVLSEIFKTSFKSLNTKDFYTDLPGLTNQLLNLEKMVYRFEKRGLPLPDHVVKP